MYWIKWETRGQEYYEDEMGPTLGYNNIQSGYKGPFLLRSTAENWCDSFDYETYRSVKVVNLFDRLRFWWHRRRTGFEV